MKILGLKLGGGDGGSIVGEAGYPTRRRGCTEARERRGHEGTGPKCPFFLVGVEIEADEQIANHFLTRACAVNAVILYTTKIERNYSEK